MEELGFVMGVMGKIDLKDDKHIGFLKLTIIKGAPLSSFQRIGTQSRTRQDRRLNRIRQGCISV